MKSFAAKTRDSLTREDTLGEKPCCRRAEITGFALSCGAVSLLGGGGTRVTMRSEHPGAVRRAMRLLRREFSAAPGMRITQASRLGGRRTFEIRLETADARALLSGCEINPLARSIPKKCLARKCCRSAFLRGVFLGCGTVADPESGYQLEFVLADEAMARALLRFLRAYEKVAAGISSRKGAWVVYVKDADCIIAILSSIGAHGAILEFENVRILRDARNRANRAANCDAANIAKMLDATDRQLGAIARIEETIGLGALPEALREVAIERRRSADASLEELGALLDPPVGKSGVYHRLRRIEAIAKNLETV